MNLSTPLDGYSEDSKALIIAFGAVTPPRLMRNSITLRGIYLGSRQMFTEMNRAVAAHHIKPVIDECFAFGDARDAYHRMRSGGHFGKLVIDFA